VFYRIIKEDPYNYKVMCIHISSLVELKLKNELYYCSHTLVEQFPNSAISWYAVAAYYYLVGNFESSRRYFR
jgi:anaphase-promoting complex subunit 6